MRPVCLALLLALVATACSSTAPEPALVPTNTKAFSAQSFFNGRTEGQGTLKQIMSATRPVQVHGQGMVEKDGTLILEQTVVDGDAPPRMRRWRLLEGVGGRFTGTMTDAIGPVVGNASGERLELRFTMEDGMKAAQWLWMEPDGVSAHNTIVIRKFGIKVAVIDQIIRKMD